MRTSLKARPKSGAHYFSQTQALGSAQMQGDWQRSRIDLYTQEGQVKLILMKFSNLYQNIQYSGHVILFCCSLCSLHKVHRIQVLSFPLVVLLLLLVKGITDTSNPNPSLSGDNLFLFPL